MTDSVDATTTSDAAETRAVAAAALLPTSCPSQATWLAHGALPTYDEAGPEILTRLAPSGDGQDHRAKLAE